MTHSVSWDQNASPLPALALAAHGSAEDARCAEPVYRHAKAIERLGLFREVHCIFWKQRPWFRELHQIASPGRMVVVPLMTSAGYYARTILVRELQDGRNAEDDSICIARPIGTMPGIADLVLAQASSAAASHGTALTECSLVIVGHGTGRDPLRSGASTWACAKRLVGLRAARSVHAAFLEQLPGLTAAVSGVPGDWPIIIVPNLIADGGHAKDDIPRALGFDPGDSSMNLKGRRLVQASAVGEHHGCRRLILDAASEALNMLPTEAERVA
jgi:sirohydrochlorin ferrochelatase